MAVLADIILCWSEIARLFFWFYWKNTRACAYLVRGTSTNSKMSPFFSDKINARRPVQMDLKRTV